MKTTKVSRADAIDRKCRDCIHDPVAAGTWREQVAACTSSDCALYFIRPTPAGLRKRGEIDPVALAVLRQRLETADRASSRR